MGWSRGKNKSRRKGGAATAFPLQYFGAEGAKMTADPGQDLLKAVPPQEVRPRIGGKRGGRLVTKKQSRQKKHKKYKKQKGGFVPSVMEGFVASASKYIVPLALFMGYRLFTKKQNKKSRVTKKNK
jgi:hypothetical protein